MRLLWLAAIASTAIAASAQVKPLTGPPTYLGAADQLALRTVATQHCRNQPSEQQLNLCKLVQEQHLLAADSFLAAHVRTDGNASAAEIKLDCLGQVQGASTAGVRPFATCVAVSTGIVTRARCEALYPSGDPDVRADERSRCYNR